MRRLEFPEYISLECEGGVVWFFLSPKVSINISILDFPLMDVHSQRHHGAADVEVVGEGEDGHEELPNLKRAVVEQLHRLLSQVAYKQ